MLRNLCKFNKVAKTNKGSSWSHGISEHEDDTVASEEHLADEAVFVDGFGLLLSLPCLWVFGPHFLHVLEDHIAVAVKGLHSAQQLLVISAVDQHLSVVADTLCEDR